MRLRLHYAPDNASLIVRLALEEAGLAYDTVLVDRRARGQHAPAYLALNPSGTIPVLETPEGPLSETGAILLWLSEKAPALVPPVSRPLFLKWLFFISNTLHAELRQLFHPDRHIDAAGQPAFLAYQGARLRTHFALLDAACARDPALFAAPSVLGAYAVALMRWSVLYGQAGAWFVLADCPALAAMARDWEGRPSVAALMRAEGMGPAPFTAPGLPDPPEGAAL